MKIKINGDVKDVTVKSKTASNLLKPIAIKNNYLTTENHRKTKYL